MSAYLTSIYWNDLIDMIPVSTHWICQNCHMSYQLICSKEIWYELTLKETFRIVAVTFSIFFYLKKKKPKKLKNIFSLFSQGKQRNS